MKEYFSQQVKTLRTGLGLSQEELATRLGISTQAVSKWECALSYPDIELLPKLAEVFQVSVDSLLGVAKQGGEESIVDEPICDETTCEGLSAFDESDNTLHIVWVQNGRILQSVDPNSQALLLCDNMNLTQPIHVEIHGNANIDGCINGGVTTRMNLTCDSINGGVIAGMSVECDNVGGSVQAGMTVNCDSVGGSVNAVTVNCDSVGGSVSAGMDVNAENISGDVINAKQVKCEVIHGNVKAESVQCEVIRGKTGPLH